MELDKVMQHRPSECPLRERKRGPRHCRMCIIAIKQTGFIGYYEAGETYPRDGSLIIGNFRRKKWAEAKVAEMPHGRWIEPYLYGKYRDGWVVCEGQVNPADLPF